MTKNKYAVVLTEYTAQYKQEIVEGWNQKSRKLLLFDDSDQAEEALISYYEAQDCDYKVEVQELGYVEVGSDVEEIHEKPHEPDCECGQCTGEAKRNNCYRCGKNPITNEPLGLCTPCDLDTAYIIARYREKDRKNAESIQKLMRGEKLSWLEEPVQGRC